MLVVGRLMKHGLVQQVLNLESLSQLGWLAKLTYRQLQNKFRLLALLT